MKNTLALNASKTFRVLVVAILFPLLSGCYTNIISHTIIGGKSDWFSPTALYKSKVDAGLAVEGTLTKAGEHNGVPAYLVIPQKVLVAAHLQTRGDVTFSDISSLPPSVRQQLHLQEKLTSDYEKIADVQNQGGMYVNPRTTVNIRAVGTLPFAFAIDVVAFPLEIYVAKELKEHPIE